MSEKIDGIVPGQGPRAVEVSIRPGSLGVGIFYQGNELFSADGVLLAEAILRAAAAHDDKAKRWLDLRSKI